MSLPLPSLEAASIRMDRDWGERLDDAETYAASGCDTAPPQMLGISADFFYDLVRLAKCAIKHRESQ